MDISSCSKPPCIENLYNITPPYNIQYSNL